MKLKIGNFKGPKGDKGNTGEKGDAGETGQRGSRWISGTAVTGTSAIGTKFPDSGITDALVHDCYVNVNTGNIYECTVSGTADVAEWAHIGNIKGPTGATGPAGSISDINNQKPTYSEAAELKNIESGETVQVSFGKLKKAVSVLISNYMQKATQSILGHVKLSNSAAITTPGEYALDAIEKNASVEGTLANMLGQINSNLSGQLGNLTFTTMELGVMPNDTETPNFFDFPDGFNEAISFVIAIRVVRNNIFVYSNDGRTCNIVFDRGQISVYATEYGITYCKDSLISCVLAKIG